MRILSPEEQALWAKVVDSVRPLRAGAEPGGAPPVPSPKTPVSANPTPSPARAAAGPGTTLDGSWDRRLSRGMVAPDLSVDLHGHNLAAAYDLLDSSLDRAIRSGARLLLLITGKPPRGAPPVARGRIRAAAGDWLAASPHAADIAAVRNAHPRHGGTGALYIVLRRPRPKGERRG
jgi:DNA-nicking Smr family endonuclease